MRDPSIVIDTEFYIGAAGPSALLRRFLLSLDLITTLRS